MEFPEPLISTPRRAGSVTVLTGSGISAESGVPNFREAQTGLWSSYDPQELATPDAFQRDPRLVWEWDTWRRMLVEKARPNAGHLALASLQKRIETFTLITQNVDGLHQRAGSEDVLEFAKEPDDGASSWSIFWMRWSRVRTSDATSSATMKW